MRHDSDFLEHNAWARKKKEKRVKPRKMQFDFYQWKLLNRTLAKESATTKKNI
jgi:hypothetical protein